MATLGTTTGQGFAFKRADSDGDVTVEPRSGAFTLDGAPALRAGKPRGTFTVKAADFKSGKAAIAARLRERDPKLSPERADAIASVAFFRAATIELTSQRGADPDAAALAAFGGTAKVTLADVEAALAALNPPAEAEAEPTEEAPSA